MEQNKLSLRFLSHVQLFFLNYTVNNFTNLETNGFKINNSIIKDLMCFKLMSRQIV